MLKLKLAATAVFVLGVFAPAGLSQEPPYPERPKPPDKPQPDKPAPDKPGDKDKGISAADKQFINNAATGGMLEVRLGELARKQGASEDVKRFGERMVAEHGKANDELKQLAEKKKVELPKDLPNEQKAEIDRLSKLRGAEFDRAYIDFMVTDHTQDVNAFGKQAKDGQDADVKGWARKTLPTLESHLKHAQEIKSKLG